MVYLAMMFSILAVSYISEYHITSLDMDMEFKLIPKSNKMSFFWESY